MANDTARNVDRAWELMKKGEFAMRVTGDDDKLRSRPMSARPEREENAIYFLTDARHPEDKEVARNASVNLSFADAGSQKYISVTGSAAGSNDCVLKATSDAAEFRDMPGSVISHVKMAAAAATGTRPHIGENRKVAM